MPHPRPSEPVRIFTVADDRFFLGTVGMVNSLRLTESAVPVTVLDAGLRDAQRRLLGPHCDLVTAPPSAAPPVLRKMLAPLESDAQVVVLVDSDVVVTGPLDQAVRAAANGAVQAFTDPVSDRWFEEWSAIFALGRPLRREPYVNSGFVALSPRAHPGLLERWQECCASMAQRALLGASDPADPTWLADQDALNALLMSEVPPGATRAGRRGEMALGPDLRRVRVHDLERLDCRLGGAPVTMLHSVGRPKPWQPRARWEHRPDAYVRCLRRALTGPDVAIRVPAADLPSWLRPGPRARVVGWTLRAYEVPARWTRPLRRRVGLSPLRRRPA